MLLDKLQQLLLDGLQFRLEPGKRLVLNDPAAGSGSQIQETGFNDALQVSAVPRRLGKHRQLADILQNTGTRAAKTDGVGGIEPVQIQLDVGLR